MLYGARIEGIAGFGDANGCPCLEHVKADGEREYLVAQLVLACDSVNSVFLESLRAAEAQPCSAVTLSHGI